MSTRRIALKGRAKFSSITPRTHLALTGSPSITKSPIYRNAPRPYGPTALRPYGPTRPYAPTLRLSFTLPRHFLNANTAHGPSPYALLLDYRSLALSILNRASLPLFAHKN